MYSNTLESHLINLKGQDNFKTQKLVKNDSKILITIYLCNIYIMKLKFCFSTIMDP